MNTTARRDRIAGTVIGLACGDALGAGYEFGPPLAPTEPVDMIGGGPFRCAPGEWTDDTAMTWAIGAALSRHRDPAAAMEQTVADWERWARTAPDVGAQTRAVLAAAMELARRRDPAATHPSAADARLAARTHHEQFGRSGGNGSLMRTAPVALAHLADGAETAMDEAAAAFSALTHADPEAGEACVLWCRAIRSAVRTGRIGIRPGLAALPDGRAAVWTDRLDHAESATPADFERNGWVVEALQAAWSAVCVARRVHDVSPDSTGAQRAAAFTAGVEAAVRGGRDADTVAAIAGALLGAACGASAVDEDRRRILHGWPGRDADDLAALALELAAAGAEGPPATARRHGSPYPAKGESG